MTGSSKLPRKFNLDHLTQTPDRESLKILITNLRTNLDGLETLLRLKSEPGDEYRAVRDRRIAELSAMDSDSMLHSVIRERAEDDGVSYDNDDDEQAGGGEDA